MVEDNNKIIEIIKNLDELKKRKTHLIRPICITVSGNFDDINSQLNGIIEQIDKIKKAESAIQNRNDETIH